MNPQCSNQIGQFAIVMPPNGAVDIGFKALNVLVFFFVKNDRDCFNQFANDAKDISRPS